jgi:hypothetical protein
MKATVAVLFTADERCAPSAAVAVASIVDRHDPERTYEIMVLDRGMTEETQNRLAAMSNGSVRVSCLPPLTEQDADDPLLHCAEERLSRFGRVLLLDADVVLLKDCALLYDCPMAGARLVSGGRERPCGARLLDAQDKNMPRPTPETTWPEGFCLSQAEYDAVGITDARAANAVLLHYTGARKPTAVPLNPSHLFFYQYAGLTPFRDALNDAILRCNLGRRTEPRQRVLLAMSRRETGPGLPLRACLAWVAGKWRRRRKNIGNGRRAS